MTSAFRHPEHQHFVILSVSEGSPRKTLLVKILHFVQNDVFLSVSEGSPRKAPLVKILHFVQNDDATASATDSSAAWKIGLKCLFCSNVGK